MDIKMFLNRKDNLKAFKKKLENEKGFVEGMCCEYCIKNGTDSCPVKEASPWSKWKNFCNEFDNKSVSFD